MHMPDSGIGERRGLSCTLTITFFFFTILSSDMVIPLLVLILAFDRFPCMLAS